MLKKMTSLIGTVLLLVVSLPTQSEAQVLIQAQSYISGSGAPSGPIYFPDGTIALPSITAASQTNKGFSFTISNYTTLSGNGAAIWQAGGTGGGKGQFFASDAFLGWSTTSNPNATTDIFMYRTGAKALQFDTDGAAGALTSITFRGPITSSNDYNFSNGGSRIVWSGHGIVASSADGLIQIEQNAATHQVEFNIGTAAPTLTTCGTGTVTAHSTNTAGEVTATGATTCTVTFAAPNFSNQPFCTATDETTLATLRVSAISASAMTITNLTANDKFMYQCIGGI